MGFLFYSVWEVLCLFILGIGCFRVSCSLRDMVGEQMN